MASDVIETQEQPAEIVTPTQEPRPIPPRPQRMYRRRFIVAYAVLALAFAAAVAGAIVAATGSLTGGDAAWSTWQPESEGQAGAKQIAAHVSKQYRLPSGEQLLDVLAKPPSVSPADQQIPIHYLAVRGRKGADDEVIPVNSDDTVQYSLCGLGESCAIATGKPSVQRGTLVRREILELALYTFKYMGGIKNVIAFMPPTPGSSPKYVVFLQKEDLGDYLHRPLLKTLDAKTPLPNGITRREQQTIDATTESRVYSFSLSQAQQGDAILVLAPLPA